MPKSTTVTMSKQTPAICLLIFAIAWVVVGCAPSYESSVFGVVTLDNQPLPLGTVKFYPVGPGPVAYGKINADGSYAVKIGSDDGLPPGEYIVTVVSMTPPPEGVSRELGELLTPQRYGQQQSSDLKFTVEPGKNVIDLELHSES